MNETTENKIILYTSGEGKVCINVLFKGETFWATQRTIGELFNTTTDNIGLHLKNIFDEDELDIATTTEKISVVQREGNRNVRREATHYNLDAIKQDEEYISQFDIEMEKYLKGEK